jgi:FkbM family methyltransferase
MTLVTELSLQEQLESLLHEGVNGALAREQNEFDRLTHPLSDKLVLFGARKLGKRTLKGLRAAGLEPIAFCDGDRALWDTHVEGVPVFSPEVAAKRFGSEAAFVITIWGYGTHDSFSRRKKQLQELGCKTVVSFVPLYWKYAGLLLPHNAMDLPHHVQESAPDVARCFAVLSDNDSREEFIQQIAWRVTGDFDALSDPAAEEIYFPHWIQPLGAEEAFVDCGAFDGDTILRFLQLRRDCFRSVTAFEPDPLNRSALSQTVGKIPASEQARIRVFPYALSDRKERVQFSATGTLGAAVGAGDYEVDCVTLDEVLGTENPTYIKMDIEGAEPGALRGSSKVIRNNSPVIAACSYHVQSHLWQIPLIMSEICPEYCILLRQHIQLVEDLVAYAVPKARLRVDAH